MKALQTRWQTLIAQHPRAHAIIQLTRLDRPVGIWLLLWPTWWSLWLAAKGFPSWQNLLIFTLGCILMRSAGCAINDFADRHFDGHVARTRHRPLATGALTPRDALTVFAVLCAVSAALVLLTSPLVIGLAVGALALAAIYPYCKRHTYLPQVVLGAAFAWAIPMAWAAETGSLKTETWLLYCSVLLWTVAYDTLYAMADREDDLRIGIRSTAILFGEADRIIIGLLQLLVLSTWLMIGHKFQMSWPFHAGWFVAACLFGWQQRITQTRDPAACLRAFRNNQWVGVVLFIGIAADFWLRPAH